MLKTQKTKTKNKNKNKIKIKNKNKTNKQTKNPKLKLVNTCLPSFINVIIWVNPTTTPGGNKIIFSSGARFQLVDFLNVTHLN